MKQAATCGDARHLAGTEAHVNADLVAQLDGAHRHAEADKRLADPVGIRPVEHGLTALNT